MKKNITLNDHIIKRAAKCIDFVPIMTLDTEGMEIGEGGGQLQHAQQARHGNVPLERRRGGGTIPATIG